MRGIGLEVVGIDRATSKGGVAGGGTPTKQTTAGHMKYFLSEIWLGNELVPWIPHGNHGGTLMGG